jgi:hypothetical protein
MAEVDVKKLDRVLNDLVGFSEETRGMAVALIAFVSHLPGANEVDFQKVQDTLRRAMPQGTPRKKGATVTR